MRAYAQTVVLFLLGGMLAKLVLTGTFLRYVGDGYGPLLAFASAALLVIAAVNLWRDLDSARRATDAQTRTGLRLDGLFGSERRRIARPAEPEQRPSPAPPGPPHGAGDLSDVDHRSRALAAGRAAAAHEGLEAPLAAVAAGEPGPAALAAPTAALATVAPSAAGRAAAPRHATPRGPGRTWGGWPLLAVALAVLLLAPSALGPFPASRAGALAGVGPAADPLPPGDPVSMSLVEYLAHAAAGGPGLAERQVRLVGFVIAGPRGEPYLARLVIGCCAAGARPVKVGLTGDLPGVLNPGSWVAVVGTYIDRRDHDPVNGAVIPYVAVVSVTQIEAPADPYES